jgi:hypothetical protein
MSRMRTLVAVALLAAVAVAAPAASQAKAPTAGISAQTSHWQWGG